MDQINVGIIGFGYMGHHHYNKILATEGLRAYAVFDIDPAKLDEAETLGLKAYRSAESFLADESIGLVQICTSNETHAMYACMALSAGKHVMAEKPVTMNLGELEEVIQCARKNGKIFTVHQNRRWDADYLTVKNVVRSGGVGKVTTIQSSVFGERGVCFGWRADPEKGGGMLLDWGVHLIDQMIDLFPEEPVTSIHARMLSVLTPAVDDYFELRLGFTLGTVAQITVGTFALEKLSRWFVNGDKGTLKIETFDPATGSLRRIRGDVKGFESVSGQHTLGPSRTMAPLKAEHIECVGLPEVGELGGEYYRNLASCLAGREQPHVAWSQMRRVMQIVDLARESALSNQVLHVSI
ncbi:MAG: Gfo/Idh/MocA family oxidoreductase [Clostridiaceae bacterium]